jgi:hypothetical protein
MQSPGRLAAKQNGANARRGVIMGKVRYFAVSAVVGLCFMSFTAKADAQVSFGVQIGAQPECPYGYFDYPPYDCAPYGYYGPEWFPNGEFLGTGPWYHRGDNFRGHVDRRYDPRDGYRGALPHRGERPDWEHHHGTVEGFRGNDIREEQPRGDNGGRNHNNERDNNGGRNYNNGRDNNGGRNYNDGRSNNSGRSDDGERNNNRGQNNGGRNDNTRHSDNAGRSNHTSHDDGGQRER